MQVSLKRLLSGIRIFTQLTIIMPPMAGVFFVASDGDSLIAMGGYNATDGESVELKRMRVHPNYQRTGVGSALLRALEDEAVRSGFKRAHLDTANAKAKPFYKRNGYSFTKSEIDGGFVFYFFEKLLLS
ncbi:MAG: GNAT family N-acetyltransferase [Proteobacteria bacterium]|nr:MAG: GNAT family N-acetyltransferase [Pseudomonadota bacterium]